MRVVSQDGTLDVPYNDYQLFVSGKVKTDEGYKTCSKCRNKLKIKKRIRDAKKGSKLDAKREWVMNGKCWFCGEPVYNHSKLCKKH